MSVQPKENRNGLALSCDDYCHAKFRPRAEFAAPDLRQRAHARGWTSEPWVSPSGEQRTWDYCPTHRRGAA